MLPSRCVALPSCPMTCQLVVRKITTVDASNSCNVQPLSNHSLRLNEARSEGCSTSGKYATQTLALRYHSNMQFTPSESSAALSCLIQQLSTQIHSSCGKCLLTYCAKLDTLFEAVEAFTRRLSISANVTSDVVHRCERIAYGGGCVGNCVLKRRRYCRSWCGT